MHTFTQYLCEAKDGETHMDPNKKYPKLSTHDLKPGDNIHAHGNAQRSSIAGEVTKVNPKKVHYKAKYPHTVHDFEKGTSHQEDYLHLNAHKHELHGAHVARPAEKPDHFHFYTLHHEDKK